MVKAFTALIGVISVASASAGACSSDEQAKLADGNVVGKKASDCGLKSYNIVSGKFNHDKFNSCFTASAGVGNACSECYAASGETSASNCKTACLAGWCKQGCLDCTKSAQDTLATCTGFQSGAATPCLEVSKSCSGEADPAGPACYSGSTLGETVKVNLVEVDAGKGKLEFTGSGAAGFTCTGKTYTKSGQELAVSDVSDCLPSGVELSKVEYCSDDDTVHVTVKDKTVPLPITAIAKKVACGAGIFDLASSCTGSADPPGPACYEGKAGALGVTETVKVNLKEIDTSTEKGKIDFTGSGITGFTCTDKTVTKNGQELVLADSSDCLPKGVEVSKIAYCSDDDVVHLTVKDKSVPLPISATLKKVACGSELSV